MRKGRFAGLSDKGQEAVTPPELAELLLFDFTPAADEDDHRAARERARSVQLSIPLLAGSHALWASVLVAGLAASGATAGLAALVALLLAILLLDASLWFALKRRKLRPYQAMRLAALHGVATAGLWLLSATLVAPEAQTLLVKAALVAGAGSAIAVFFTVPLLMILAVCTTFLVGTAMPSDEPVLAIGGAFSLFLLCLGVARSRQFLFAARQRLALEWQAEKARRFVADFEASGRGWFWETNADGALTYVSEPLAAHLGLSAAELIGRRFEDVLLLDSADGDDSRRTLGFHLSARFPFADAVVRAPTGEDVWWSLSGSPNFDGYGRFLGFRGLGSNLSEQRRSEAEASKLARYDSLTGLPNRAMMRSMLDEALANADARRRGCALMIIDLDRFKQVNDTLGHPVGDKLLKKVAGRLSKVLGEDGQVGRLGGDEFEAILPGIEEEGRLSELARRLIEQVSKPYRIEGHEVRIGTSVGIAVAVPGKTLAEGLIKDADVALYAAKADGRGTFRFFAQEMHALATERQILETDLRYALANDQLTLVYQPIVDSVSEEVVAFEALLRWHHPGRGLLPPALVIPLAEETGLMPRIGDWVLRTACAEAAKWPRHIRVAVNLSPVQFADPALAATVTGTLAASQLDPERLELEINEAVFLADRKVTEATLTRLRGLGVRLALDNFGTGHSGLGHLRDAPLDKIKIDQSFVRGATAPGSRNGAIVRAIVVLAESLGMDTTAEGAETIEELSLIRRLGCSQVQGYIFAKPMPASEALTLATESRPTAEVIGFSRPPRHRLIRNGRLVWQGRTLPVRLRNISAGGAMIECDSALEPGTLVELDLSEAGTLAAEVRWCQQGQVGIHFGEEFALGKLARTQRKGGAPKMVKPEFLEPRKAAK
ncbi:MAG TPA: EAL domain-containing protein [Allosphingosinicella sp.]|jgi:diguanylate cyclase (GGDEF)-like protein/PAS domain S-box-containing protein